MVLVPKFKRQRVNYDRRYKRYMNYTPPQIERIINSASNKVGTKHIILMKKCLRDIIRRVFYINTVDARGIVTSYRHIKYYYRNAALDGISNDTVVIEKDMGIIIPGTHDFNVIMNIYLYDGYSLQDI